jgi:hypothetical protein
MTVSAQASGTNYPNPEIYGFSPTSGPPGTVITVNGSGFTGLSAAWIGSGQDSKISVVSDAVVMVTVPKDATTAHLGLLNPQKSVFSPITFTVTTAAAPAPVSPTGTVISGQVSGVTNVSVQLTGKAISFSSTNTSGNYRFAQVSNGLYTLAPTHPGYIFSPSSLAVTVNGASVSGSNFTAEATSATTYGITGTVNGAAAGVIVTLNGANVGSAATDDSGNYGFFGLTSGTYTVSASLDGYTFSQAKTIVLGIVDSTGNNFTAMATPANSKVQLKSYMPMTQATVGQHYSKSLVDTVSGGTPPYHYQSAPLANGFPPVGMIVNPNGTLAGTPKSSGSTNFNICAIDSVGNKTASCAPASITSVTATASSPPTPAPSPTPTPAPASGTSWVYYDGVFEWPGDYSFVATPDYQDTSGEPLSGPYDIKVTITSAWGGWLPYALNWNFNSAPYTKLTFALKPTVENQQWNVYFVKVGDVPVGIYIDPTQYGPAPVVGQWATYTIPLSVLGVQGDPIYKFCIHDETGLSNNVWYVDNVGFEP